MKGSGAGIQPRESLAQRANPESAAAILVETADTVRGKTSPRFVVPEHLERRLSATQYGEAAQGGDPDVSSVVHGQGPHLAGTPMRHDPPPFGVEEVDTRGRA